MAEGFERVLRPSNVLHPLHEGEGWVDMSNGEESHIVPSSEILDTNFWKHIEVGY